ncbi:unnamed protein product [Pleuronectes platessa]|uniref:Mitochondrial ribosomal protein S35 n=1 Tax=Pleuronectes platessa TaxID=8262 RepID=A0A9N7TNA2_PLEPL|nr:unnamed protein product [Pleuronectes platessa]
MASHSSKVFLCLGRAHARGPGLQGTLNRVTYSTAASVNHAAGNRGPPDRGGRGPFIRKPRREAGEPRTEKMSVDQDWTAVYPSATPFRSNTVPLPVRMGYPVKRGVPPEKKGNLELIKIPNFLHLTPAAIKKHCEALKPFCTEWPSALDTEAKCDEHFPVKVESTDYLSAGLTVRNPAARIVHLKVKMSTSDVLTITTDSCPLRKQNLEYATYLLTVLYHESWKTEAWEAEKTVADMEEYSWEESQSQKNILDTLVRMKVAGEGEGEEVREQLLGRREVQEYKDSVERLKNEGDSESPCFSR